MKTKFRLTLVVGTALASCLLAPLQPASSAAPRPVSAGDLTPDPNVTVTDNGWVEYSSNLEELDIDATTDVVDGTPGAGGSCTVVGVDTVSEDSPTLTVREEVAFNPATCETRYLVAELTKEEAAEYLGASPAMAADTTEEATEQTSSKAAPSAKSGTMGAAAASATWNAWVRTAWVDPIEIDISSTRTALRWNSTQWLKRQVGRNSFKGCIGSVCLDETYVVSKNNYYGNYSNRFEFSGVTHFRNKAFAAWVIAIMGAGGWAACGFPTSTTANFHHDGQVVGYKSGAWKWKWQDSKNGACTNLVHHEGSNGSGWPF